MTYEASTASLSVRHLTTPKMTSRPMMLGVKLLIDFSMGNLQEKQKERQAENQRWGLGNHRESVVGENSFDNSRSM